MANYCYNCIRVRGTKASIEKFHNILLGNFTKKHSSIYELLLAHKYTENELKDVDRRDYVSDVEKEISFDEERKEYYFNFYTESAWGPNLEMLFCLMVDKYDGEIEIIYISEECGNEIYRTNDENHEVWQDRYFLDFYINHDFGTEYLSSKEELIKFIKANFDVEVGEQETIQNMEGRIRQKYGIKENSEQYIYIHEFEFDDNMYAVA